MWLRALSLVLSAGVILAHESSTPPWWTTAVFYQIYPRSFQDTNDDGVGDIKGILQRADYFKQLGVTAVWISPMYRSPLADFGYDISNFREIDPQFGTMDDLKALIEKFHELDIKILMDLVPNHTSDEHEWFQKSVQKIDPYTDYYVWVDGKLDTGTGERVAPNNWISNITGGSAWTWNEKRQQFYLHQFLDKQPDLNYRNPNVVKEMEDIISFWLNMGMDGFRVDAVPFLFETENVSKDEPTVTGIDGGIDLEHIYTQNQPETYKLCQSWGQLVYNLSQTTGRDLALFLEAYATVEQTMGYYGKGDERLMQPFNFLLLGANQGTTASQMKQLMTLWLDNMPAGASPNWVISNHDQSRAATRYGPTLADGMNMMIMMMPGVCVIYYGQEIGMTDTYITFSQTVDPQGLSLGPQRYQSRSRDPERTPMQWDDTSSAGFSTNRITWLPVNPEYWMVNVEQQKKAKTSHWKIVQTMAKVRQDPVMVSGDVQVIARDDTLIIVRTLNSKSYCLLVNMGSEEVVYNSTIFDSINLNGNLAVVVNSLNVDTKTGYEMEAGKAHISLRPKGAILIKTE